MVQIGSTSFKILTIPHSQPAALGPFYDADDTKWVPWGRMGSGTHFLGQNGFIL
jgi:hypothetical protein